MPTQKPVHIGQLSNCPNFPDFGLIGSNIFPYINICVRPYEIRQNQINVINLHFHSLELENSYIESRKVSLTGREIPY